jgi:hypothetical protein
MGGVARTKVICGAVFDRRVSHFEKTGLMYLQLSTAPWNYMSLR